MIEVSTRVDAGRRSVFRKVPLFLQAIKFQESIFALPFAYTGMLLAADGLPTWSQLIWITVAMITARTFGMSANRIIDRHVDGRNPSAAQRHLPSGRLRVADMAAPALAALALFLFAASRLNTLALALTPVAAAYLVLYPYTKRFTWTANLLLGWALAIAPAAAWIGVRGSLSGEPVLLSAAVALWAGSFDTLYHSQDYDFHVKEGLHSIARRFGVPGALWWARVLDAMALGCLLALGAWMELGYPFYAGWAIALAILAYKHALVWTRGYTRTGAAFFHMNAYVSTTVLAATMIAVLV